MAEYLAQNLVEVTLDGGIDASQTTIPLATGEGANLASTAGMYQYPLTVYDSRYAAPHLDPNVEIVLVTSHDGSSDTLSVVTRGQEGTSAVDHNTNGVIYKAQAPFTKGFYDNLIQKVHWKEYFYQQRLVSASDIYSVSSNISRPWGNVTPAATTLTYSADRLYAQPGFMKAGTVVRMFKYRKNAGNSQSVRIGIYSDVGSGNLYPDELLVEASATNDNSVSPVLSLEYTIPVDGIYWVAVVFSSGIAIRNFSTDVPFDAFLGFQLHSSTVEAVNTGIYVAHTFGALPDPFPSISGATLMKSTDTQKTPPLIHYGVQA